LGTSIKEKKKKLLRVLESAIFGSDSREKGEVGGETREKGGNKVSGRNNNFF